MTAGSSPGSTGLEAVAVPPPRPPTRLRVHQQEALAALSGGWLESILYGVTRQDGATIASVAALICAVTGIATYLPARRAASIEPTEALRKP